jgi:hypothetical protein
LKYNEEHIINADLRAESIVAALFYFKTKFDVNTLGCFFKNYCEDIIEVTEDGTNESLTLDLSRDGIYHLLPESLFFHENRLLIKKRGHLKKSEVSQADAIKEEIKKQNTEKKKLLSFFKFFDTQYFLTSLMLEKTIFDIENEKTTLIIKSIFNFDIASEDNPHIKKMACFLIYASQIRGDLFLLQKILSVILNCCVEIKKRNKHIDGLSETILSIEFLVHIEGLSLKEYVDLNAEYEPLFYFVGEWFLPFEMDYSYKIKDKTQQFVLQKPLILDYNTQLQ